MDHFLRFYLRSKLDDTLIFGSLFALLVKLVAPFRDIILCLGQNETTSATSADITKYALYSLKRSQIQLLFWKRWWLSPTFIEMISFARDLSVQKRVTKSNRRALDGGETRLDDSLHACLCCGFYARHCFQPSPLFGPIWGSPFKVYYLSIYMYMHIMRRVQMPPF